MSTATVTIETATHGAELPIQSDVQSIIESMIVSLPNPEDLSAEQRRAVIARYSAVLEGNFIYWMTGAYLATKSKESHEIILDNLLEEVRDSHPLMLRKFSLAANAFPTDGDSMAVDDALCAVRLFVGRLSTVPLLIMMAFFEGYIQRFMPFLAELAGGQGSAEREYTDVHGVCDIAHTDGLFRALKCEWMLNPPAQGTDLFEGARLLRGLIEVVLQPAAASPTLN